MRGLFNVSRETSLFERVFELSAGAIDIGAARIAQRGLGALLLNRVEPAIDGFRFARLEYGSFDGVDGDEIDVAEEIRAELLQSFEVFVSVIHAVDHDVLEGNASIGLRNVLLQCAFQIPQLKMGDIGH